MFLDQSKNPGHIPPSPAHATAILSERSTADAPGKRHLPLASPPAPWTEARLKELVLHAGADDAGVIAIDRAEIAPQRREMESTLPGVRTVIAFVMRMNRANVQSTMRSVANREFHESIDEVNEVAHRAVLQLERLGVRAVNPAAAFPMEMDRFPEKSWVVSHKPVAVAAGLGQMGIHRNIIHPRFGNFILLGTILTDIELEPEQQARPIDYNPCFSCKLCVAACPVGAISKDGAFDFSACYTHNYREFMSGFSDFVEDVATAKSRADLRAKRPVAETVSMWQSLAYGPNYKAAYCMAVCPAGEEVLAPFLHDKPQYMSNIVRPLQDKTETLYVIPGSSAERYAEKRFPHKSRKQVSNGLYATSIAGFLRAAHLAFLPLRAKDLAFTAHFTFWKSASTPSNPRTTTHATFRIADQRLEVSEGHQGEAQLRVTAEEDTWLRISRGDQGPLWALLRGRLRVRGFKWLVAFKRCFA